MAQQTVQKHMIEQYGPYGSQLPENYSFKLQPGETIKEVIIRHGFIVDAIGFVVAKPFGGTYTKMFGGTCGNESKIVLKCGEKITRISGTYGNYIYQRGECLIGTMKIHTNLCPNGYGPFGQGKGIESSAKDFSSPYILDGPIVGIFGRHHNYLESVGIFVQKMLQKYGPYGDKQAAITYDFQVDPSKERLSKIIIRSGMIVDAIGFGKIDKSTGKETLTPVYGGKGGNEYTIGVGLGVSVTKITGMSKNSQISQLMIYTDDRFKNKYGPYGSNTGGKAFASPDLPDNESIIGFFGSANENVASIGFNVQVD